MEYLYLIKFNKTFIDDVAARAEAKEIQDKLQLFLAKHSASLKLQRLETGKQPVGIEIESRSVA